MESPSPFEEHCRDACEKQACLGTPTGGCEEGCAELERIYQGECLTLYDDVAQCQISLTCDELGDFAADPSNHPQCGTAYSAFLASCGYGGEVPQECVAYCDVLELCASDQYYIGCADECAQSLVVFEAAHGIACADSLRQFNGCVGTLTCAELDQLLDPQPGQTPSCGAEAQAYLQACQ